MIQLIIQIENEFDMIMADEELDVERINTIGKILNCVVKPTNV
jgi:acyl carrier protein